MKEEFLAVNELSQYLGIKRSSLYSIVERREIPFYKIGRLIRFKRSDIDLWLESKKEGCIDVSKEAGRILRAAKSNDRDIRRIVQKAIAEIAPTGYTSLHGKPDQVKGLGKEVDDGSV